MNIRSIFEIYGEEKGWPRYALNIFVLGLCARTRLYNLDRITGRKNRWSAVTHMERSI